VTDVSTCWCFGKAAKGTIIRENTVVSRHECTGFDVRKKCFIEEVKEGFDL